MTRYYFDVHDSVDMPDAEGTELSGRAAMRREAIRLAGEILKDVDGDLLGEEWSMTVRDEAGHLVMTLRFSASEH